MVSTSPCRKGKCIHLPDPDSDKKKESKSDDLVIADDENTEPTQVVMATPLSFGSALDERVVTSDSGQSSGFYQGAISFNDDGFKEEFAGLSKKGESLGDAAGTADIADMAGSDGADSLSMPEGGLEEDGRIIASGDGHHAFTIEASDSHNDVFNDAIFDTAPSAMPRSMKDDIGLSGALHHAVSGHEERSSDRGDNDFSVFDGIDYEKMRKEKGGSGATAPERERRSSSDLPNNAGESENQPYDLSSLANIAQGRNKAGDTQEGFLQGRSSGRGGSSMVSSMVGLVIATLVMVGIGVVGVLFLGGTQSSQMDGGTSQSSSPLSGLWHITLYADTDQGKVEFYNFESNIKVKGNEIDSVGLDEGGKFMVIGTISDQADAGIVFRKQYDLNDGNAHPFPIGFNGMLLPSGGADIAQGEFRTRLAADSAVLNLGRFTDVRGTWTAKIKAGSQSQLGSELGSSIIGQVKSLIANGGQPLYIVIGVIVAVIMSLIMFVRGQAAGSDRLRSAK